MPFYFQRLSRITYRFFIYIFSGTIIDLFKGAFVDVNNNHNSAALAQPPAGEITVRERKAAFLSRYQQFAFGVSCYITSPTHEIRKVEVFSIGHCFDQKIS